MLVYEKHIGNSKAYPEVCPICGKTGYKAQKGKNYILECLKELYSSPNQIVCREVPGWPGYKTWWYVCQHSSAMELSWNGPSWLDIIPKTENEWIGKYVPIPYMNIRD